MFIHWLLIPMTGGLELVAFQGEEGEKAGRCEWDEAAWRQETSGTLKQPKVGFT